MPEDPCLVIGATGGVGAALCAALAANGTPVFAVGRDEGRLASLGASAGHAVADVLDEAALAAAVRAAGPRLSGLAYCVGSIVLTPLGRAKSAAFIDAFRLNALGAALSVAAAEPALRAVSGSGVVLFSTVAARNGFANHAVISAAKAAVEGLTVSLAAELAPAVRVNAIAPSLTRTGMAAPLLVNKGMETAIASAHPIPRLGEAEDLAALAAFLLGPRAGWITGQILAVDGGRSTVRTKG